MDEKNLYAEMSLLEIAEQVMKKKRKPQSLDSITADVFSKKGLSLTDYAAIAQFELDFMISGIFIYCYEDGKNQYWDLKCRKPSSYLDKDGGYVDPYEEDEDVKNNELKDDIDYDDKSIVIEDEEDENEDDEIQEELGLISDDSETSEVTNEEYEGSDDDEDEEDANDEVEDLSEEFEK